MTIMDTKTNNETPAPEPRADAPRSNDEPLVRVGSGDLLGHTAPAEEYDDDDFSNGENRCHVCLGDGYVFGDELDDPNWYEPGETYRCPCCGGSGDAKDCTYW